MTMPGRDARAKAAGETRRGGDMTIPTITREQFLSWGPCGRAPGERYDDAALDTLFCGREQLTVADTARLDIPRRDVVWVWTRPGALPSDVRWRWIERIMMRAVERHALHCGVLAVEQWAQRWLAGDRSPAEAWAAWDAATGAASWAAEAAAGWAAAEAEAEEEEAEAAGWAARAAAWAAAWVMAAAWVAWAAEEAEEAEYQQQVQDLLDALR